MKDPAKDPTDELLDRFPVLALLKPLELEEEWQKRGLFLIPPEIGENLQKITGVVTNALFSGNRQPLYFLIHSNGGRTTPGWVLYNMIRSYPGPTIGVVFGRASSTAFTILQACKFRFALPGTFGLIHSLSAQIPITAFNEDEVGFRQRQVIEETNLTMRCLASRNPKVTPGSLLALAKLDEGFLLTPESGWVDAIIDLIPPLHPLPEKWRREIDAMTLGSQAT